MNNFNNSIAKKLLKFFIDRFINLVKCALEIEKKSSTRTYLKRFKSSVQNHKGLTTFSFVNNTAAKTFPVMFDDVDDRLEHPLPNFVANSVWNAFTASNEKRKSMKGYRPM